MRTAERRSGGGRAGFGRTRMNTDITLDRRRFLGGVVTAVAATQFGTISLAPEAARATAAGPPRSGQDGAGGSFGPLKQVDAGVLSVGYAESGPADGGREGYEKYRDEFAKLIWQIASPKWNFDDAIFARSAASFANPDHVSIVIHNYRWRLGLADGE